MDNLKLQTVYVPVVQPENGDRMQDYIKDDFVVARKFPNRIVLTKQELGQILLDVLILASEGMPLSPDGKNHLINQFFKAHGI